jgi:hypothetical protein
MRDYNNTSVARVKLVNVEEKKREYERQGYTFLRELSPTDADSPADLKMDETALLFKHPEK